MDEHSIIQHKPDYRIIIGYLTQVSRNIIKRTPRTNLPKN